MSSSLDYIKVHNGVTHYDFARIESPGICLKIESSCLNKASIERIKALAYLITSVVVSLLLSFSFLNFFAAQILTIYFFSSEALRKSEHYTNMHEQAGLRLAELNPQKVGYTRQILVKG